MDVVTDVFGGVAPGDVGGGVTDVGDGGSHNGDVTVTL
jgi:hypothetical protein